MQWIPFLWSSDEIDGRRFERSAMFLQGRVEPLNAEGVFQFDLGVPYSILYGRSFPGDALKPFGTSRTVRFNGRQIPIVDVSITFPTVKVEDPALLEDFGGDEELEGYRILGTVGINMVEGKVLIIDFPRKRMAILPAIPDTLNVKLAPLKRTRSGHIVLEVEMDGQKVNFAYDSGSSIFGLLTTHEIWQRLTDGVITDSFNIYAWGQKHTVYAAKLKRKVSIAGVPLQIEEAHYVDIPGGDEFFKANGITAMMGNRPFWNMVVILDLKEGRFGILKR